MAMVVVVLLLLLLLPLLLPLLLLLLLLALVPQTSLFKPAVTRGVGLPTWPYLSTLMLVLPLLPPPPPPPLLLDCLSIPLMDAKPRSPSCTCTPGRLIARSLGRAGRGVTKMLEGLTASATCTGGRRYTWTGPMPCVDRKPRGELSTFAEHGPPRGQRQGAVHVQCEAGAGETCAGGVEPSGQGLKVQVALVRAAAQERHTVCAKAPAPALTGLRRAGGQAPLCHSPLAHESSACVTALWPMHQVLVSQPSGPCIKCLCHSPLAHASSACVTSLWPMHQVLV